MAITSSTIVVTMPLPAIDDAGAPGVEVPDVVAATVDVASEAGAVNNPADVIVPPPVADHVNVGWTASALPNWSIAVAVNCWLAPAVTVATAGVTTTPVRVWATVTFTADETVRPPASVIVALNVYAPALANVATLLLAAFVPFTENATAAGPVADQAYARLDSPWSSAPVTESVVVAPVTVVGDAAAAMATVGAVLLTVTFVYVALLSRRLLLLLAERPTSTLDAIEIVTLPT
jgi:hypothetical protein